MPSLNFNYSKTFSADHDKWKYFDTSLKALSNIYYDEFKKPMYHDGSFIKLTYCSSSKNLEFSIHKDVLQSIRLIIIAKLKRMFPNRLVEL